MEQLVIIVPSTMDKKFSMAQAKKAIVEYVGTRLIDTNEKEMPGVVLKECLYKDDKKALQKAIFPDNNGCLVFVRITNDEDCPDYLNAETCEEDE